MATVEDLIDLKSKMKSLYKKIILDSKNDVTKGENVIIGEKGYSDFLELKVSDYNKFTTYVKNVRKFKEWYVDGKNNDEVECKKLASSAFACAQYFYSIFNKWKNNDIYKSAFCNIYIDLKEIKKRKETLDKAQSILKDLGVEN